MSPAGAFAAMLERYGQRVEICRRGEAPGVSCRAFVQPLRSQKENVLPSALGGVCQDRWRYLGEAQVSLEGMENGYILWQGRKFEVTAAHLVYFGGQANHWRAILKRRDPDVQEK